MGPAFSQSAWTNVTFPGAEVREPGRTFPLALLLGCALVTGLDRRPRTWGTSGRWGFPGIARVPRRIASAPPRRRPSFPAAARGWPLAIFSASTFGCANGLVLSGARVVYALAADGHLPAAAARLNAAGVPGVALALQAAWALVLVLSGTDSDLLRYVVACCSSSYTPRSRGDGPSPETPAHARPYRAWGHPATSVLFLCLAAAVVILLAIASPRTTLPGFGLVLLGIPVFLARRMGRTA